MAPAREDWTWRRPVTTEPCVNAYTKALEQLTSQPGGIETEEQLDAALRGLWEECARLVVAGKKVVVS
jgi:hypothetical protein